MKQVVCNYKPDTNHNDGVQIVRIPIWAFEMNLNSTDFMRVFVVQNHIMKVVNTILNQNELKSTRRRQTNDINTFRPQALISITNEYFPIKAETSSDRILTIL